MTIVDKLRSWLSRGGESDEQGDPPHERSADASSAADRDLEASGTAAGVNAPPNSVRTDDDRPRH